MYNWTRRRVVCSTVGLLASFSGCLSDSHVNLRVRSVSVSETDSNYRVGFNVGLGVTGDWTPFENVSAVALDERGNVVGRQHIGRIDSDYVGSEKSVSIACDQFPQTITYEIERDPCSRDVTVYKMEYDADDDVWVEKAIECE